MRRPNHTIIAALTLLGSAGATAINQDFDDVTIKPTRVADGIYMLEG
ncbi:MAG: hypothetical protein GY715_13965, partial [Planctomycetes bacterium]|nr:hypothetical protein [Planctomycetota bacterium]